MKAVLPLFELGDAADVTYINVRDSRFGVSDRQFVEKLWQRYYHLADDHFRSEIKTQFHPRFWEMYLAVVLMEHGFQPRKPQKKGPEFNISTESLTIWFDAIAPTAGEGRDAVPDYDYGSRVAREVPETQIVLRLTHAIEEKRRKFEADLQQGHIGSDDACVVAINAASIPHTWFAPGAGLPHVVRAVYPFGGLAVAIDPKTQGVLESFHQHRPTIMKQGGASVPTTSFLSEACSQVSGVLYSGLDVSSAAVTEAGSDFIFIHNSYSSATGNVTVWNGILGSRRLPPQ